VEAPAVVQWRRQQSRRCAWATAARWRRSASGNGWPYRGGKMNKTDSFGLATVLRPSRAVVRFENRRHPRRCAWDARQRLGADRRRQLRQCNAVQGGRLFSAFPMESSKWQYKIILTCRRRTAAPGAAGRLDPALPVKSRSCRAARRPGAAGVSRRCGWRSAREIVLFRPFPAILARCN
jgi:hypothetical protein